MRLRRRSIVGWCVVTRGGHPFGETFRSLRRDAISAYSERGYSDYREDYREYGVRVVKYRLTPEPENS